MTQDKATKTEYDIVVIGAGPGGYVAAIRAAQLGLKTAIVEREHLGGICLNWGCIPTKALLKSAEVAHTLKHADQFGFKVSGFTFDLSKIVERSRQVSSQLSQGIRFLMKKNKIDVIEGQGKLGKASHEVVVTNSQGQTTHLLNAKHIILATGARARVLEGLEPDGKLIWSYREAMVPKELPKSLLVIGSGAIGIEFASFYNALGVKTTVVEVMDRILPVEDAEISAIAAKSFADQGIQIITKAKVTKVSKKADSCEVMIEQEGKETKQEFARVISAVGIVGNVENLGLEGKNIKIDRTHIVVDEWCQTGEKGIYAIGDLVGAPWLAHKASHEAVMCVEKIAGKNHVMPLNTKNIPGCTYCYPQIASVGLTEQQAKDQGHKIRVGRFPFVGNGKAIALGDTQGLVKTIFDEQTGELLGAHMIGAEVTELIQGFTIAKTMETTEEDLMHTIFPHPTLSEMMHESVLSAYNQAIHI